MTARVTLWRPLHPNIPTLESYMPNDILRLNLIASNLYALLNVQPGWSYTNSVTRGEASPGTAALPTRKYWKFGTLNATKWVKTVCTWTGNNLTKAAYYYSDDNESSYMPMLDESKNYVLTLAYDGSNNLTSTSWGNTP